MYGNRSKWVKTAFKILIANADTSKTQRKTKPSSLVRWIGTRFQMLCASRVFPPLVVLKGTETKRPPIREPIRMVLIHRHLIAVVCCSGLCGCHPNFTRVPDLIPRTAAEDKAMWTYHNPFPDETVAPTVDHRPAGSEYQRTMPRQALEKDSMTFGPRGAFDPPRPEARLNPKTANVVQP